MLPPIANRFVAGDSPAEALEHVRRLNERDVNGIVNLLGEHHDDRESVDDDAAEYRRLVADIAGSRLAAAVSVKPSQLGLDLGEDVFRTTLAAVVDAAAERDVFVWIDMEDHTTTDATLDAFEASRGNTRAASASVCRPISAGRERISGDWPTSPAKSV